MASIVLYLAQAVGMVFYPFIHLGEYILSLKDKRSRNVFRLLAGACAAIPAVIFLCVLLSGADMVFRNMLSVVISKFLNPVTLFLVVLQTIFWSLAMYCLVCSAYGGSISDGMVNVRRHSPPVFLYCHIYFPDNRLQCLSRLGMVLTGGRGQPEIQIDTFLPNT